MTRVLVKFSIFFARTLSTAAVTIVTDTANKVIHEHTEEKEESPPFRKISTFNESCEKTELKNSMSFI